MAGYLRLACMPLSDNPIKLLLLTKMWGSTNRMALLGKKSRGTRIKHEEMTQKSQWGWCTASYMASLGKGVSHQSI